MKAPLLLPLFLILLVSIVSGQDFTFYAQDSVALCPCSNQAYPITIQNTGSVVSTYTLSASGQAADWVTFNPKKVQLKPNEATYSYVFVNSLCNIEGSAPLNILITDQNGVTRSLSQTLIFNKCYDYSIAFGREMPSDEVTDSIKFSEQSEYLFCKDQDLVIPLEISNHEQFANRYKLFFDGPTWAVLETESAQLQAQSKGIALIRANTAKADDGEYVFQISAISELGHVQRKIEATVEVGDCTAFAINLPNEMTVCAGTTEIIDITLENKAAIDQTVRLKVDGTTLARFQNASVFVPKKDSAETKLFVFTQDDSDFSMDVNALIGDTIVASAESKVNVLAADACYAASLNVPSKVTNYYEQDVFSAKITNKGVEKVTYQISLEGVNWASVVPRTIDLAPGQEGNLNIQINPKAETEAGPHDIILKAESGGNLVSETITISLKQKGMLSSVFATVSFYRYYLYAALLILLIIGVVSFFFIRIKNNPGKKQEKKKAEEKPFVFEPDEAEENPKKKESKKSAKKQIRKSKGTSLKIPASLWWWIIVGVLVFVGIIAVAFVKALQPIKDFFVLYSMYLLIGVGILVVMIVALRFFSRKKRK